MVSIGQFALSTCDGHKWVDIACEVNTAHKDIEIKFMRPLCPSRSYTWPRWDDICWVPTTNILFLLKAPSLTTGIGRQYYLHNDDQNMYQRYSTLISFYMISINTITNSVFLWQIKSPDTQALLKQKIKVS